MTLIRDFDDDSITIDQTTNDYIKQWHDDGDSDTDRGKSAAAAPAIIVYIHK